VREGFGERLREGFPLVAPGFALAWTDEGVRRHMSIA
jgi:hypothetical protein